MSKKRGLGKGMGALLSANPRKKPTAQTPDVAPSAIPPETGSGTAPQTVPKSAPQSASQTTHQAADKTASERPSSVAPTSAVEPATHDGAERVRLLPVDRIRRGSYQPRQHFDQTALRELADSLSQQGMIQPVLVRPLADGYEIVAGERRWRAAQLAGMHDIPAIVRELDDQSVAAVSLIENIQRKDLNPMEEAEALSRLQHEFGMTHQAVAEAVGRSRTAVSNLMRLLDLHDEVKLMLARGDIDMGHARALLALARKDQPEVARKVHRQDLSVRATEKLVKGIMEGRSSQPTNTTTDPDILSLQQRIGETLGAPVVIKHRAGGRGKLEISYTSLDELDGILAHIEKTER